MAHSKSDAVNEFELDTAKSDAGNTGEQNSGNQVQEGKAELPDSGKGDKNVPDPNKKIGFAIFIQRAKPNNYVEAMLKNKRAMEIHTLAEWQQIVKDLLNKKVN